MNVLPAALVKFAVSSPFFIFLSVWVLVVFLYSWNLSYLQIFEWHQIAGVVLLIVIPFLIAFAFSFAILKLSNVRKLNQVEVNPTYHEGRVSLLFWIFLAVTLFEIAISGYVPLFAMYSGRQVSQFEFGISGLHGFVLALGSLIATSAYYFYLKNGNKKNILFILMVLGVFAILVTRKMIILAFLQIVFVYFSVRDRIPVKMLGVVTVLAIFVVLVFGWIGDIRTGRDLFLSLSNPRVEYPSWLPSGFMWVYMYITTPILNLTNALVSEIQPSHDLQFACGLMPRIVRGAFGCPIESGFDNDYQISGAFNVATGYISLYQSWGTLGIAAFSSFHGVTAALASVFRCRGLKGILFYAVIMQITVLLLFGNGFLNLNVLAQFPLILFIFSRFKA
jgi:oligosaccharide repeat unit polymerase